MNKTLHGIIAVVFAFACLGLWGLLNLASTVMFKVSATPPQFTQLCLNWRPLLIVLPALAFCYCVYVWFRRSNHPRAWLGFFASTMMSLVVVTVPTIIAVMLPIIVFIELNA